jgi:hypothetical protein
MLVQGFVGGSDQALSPFVNNEETINLIIEQMTQASSAAKVSLAFYLRPGASEWKDAMLAGQSRGSFTEDGRAFRVIGGKFCEFNSNGVVTVHGDVDIDENPVTISSSGDAGRELFITSGGKGYIFNLDTNTLTEEVSSGCTMGGFIDTFFVYLDVSTSSFYKSASYDGTTWDPLEVTQRGLAGDPWRAMIVSESQRVIVLAGARTTDIYDNAGDSPFPFRPRPDGLIPHGIAAPFSIKDVGGLIIWVAQTARGRGYVVALSGVEVKRISHPALDKALKADGDTIERYEADAFDLNGHTFYLATIDTMTHVFDLTVGKWTKWLTWNTGLGRYDGWRATHHQFAFGKHLFGDRSSAKVFEVSQTIYTDVGAAPLRWLRRCPLPWANNRRVFISRLELIVEPGVGTGQDDQGEDPVVMMRLSFNAGKTWSAERSRTLGKQGEYDTAAVWDRCGSGTKPVVEFVGTDPVSIRILGLDATMRPGLHGRRAA